MTQTIRSIQSWSKQRQILSALTEINQLLAGMGLPLSQSPRPPTALSIKGELFRREQRATVAIVEDADFECSYCRQFEHEVYPQIAKDCVQTGKVKYFYRDLPLSTHPHAMIAARAARCAGEQRKFWEMHDSPFDEQNAIRDVDIPGRAQELGLDTRNSQRVFRATDTPTKSTKAVQNPHKWALTARPHSLSARPFSMAQ